MYAMRQPGTVSLTALRIIIAKLQTLSGGTSMKQMKSSPSKLAYMKKYREANRDKINKWRRDNRAITIPTERIWQEKYKPLKNLRRRNRYKNDPAYKILCSLRNRIRKVLNGKSKSQSSHGERQIELYLKEHNINYKPQKRFSDCKDKLPLPFDFYLPDFNTCIEYDGEQHYKPYRFSQDEKYIKKLEKTKQHDIIKNLYCKENGEFLQRPDHHLQKIGCPKCKLSHGEKQVDIYLREHNINFIPQKRFSDCKDKQPLPFDFYLPEVNICIEYDGPQHYGIWNNKKFNINFKTIKIHDEIKTNYCKQKGIRLIRIPYTIKLTEEYLKTNLVLS
jgi:very-short-patch-repair endonuclease